jgi:hypothetical protein
MSRVTAKTADPVETVAMAAESDRRSAAYRRAGLCTRCSAAASVGHALGFLRVPGPPCEKCAPVVASFPQETSHPAWRKWPRGRPDAAPTRSAGVRSVPVPVVAWTSQIAATDRVARRLPQGTSA